MLAQSPSVLLHIDQNDYPAKKEHCYLYDNKDISQKHAVSSAVILRWLLLIELQTHYTLNQSGKDINYHIYLNLTKEVFPHLFGMGGEAPHHGFEGGGGKEVATVALTLTLSPDQGKSHSCRPCHPHLPYLLSGTDPALAGFPPGAWIT